MSSMPAEVDFAPCVPGALSGGVVRTRFFDGMFLTEADLENHQTYLRTKRRLTNRALGRGVVWGLRLTWDTRTRRFRLSPGYGLDCCGNDLVVECPFEVDERSLMELSAPIFQTKSGGDRFSTRRCPQPVAPGEERKACVILEYVECPQDPRPVHRDACTTNVTRCELSRIRETTRLLVVPCPEPPKPSPLADFCSELEALREKVKTSNVESILFPMPEPAPAPSTELPLTLQVRSSSSVETLRLPGTANATSTIEVGTNADVAFEIQATDGWILYSGEVTLDDQPVAAVNPPLDLRLGWSLESGVNDDVFEAEVGFASLFDDTSRKVVRFRITRVIDGSGQLSFSYTTLGVSSEALDPPAPAPCWRLLEGVVFSGSPLCIAKGALLAAVYAWLKSLIDAEDTTNRWTGPRLLSAWTYLIAWRLLFGANAGGTERAELTKLLSALFKKWCSGMHYSGPRCADETHGVYLGTVSLSANGAIVGFDPWEHRRHVITGPLVTHWAGQFGLAPLDEVAGRFARAICCVAGHSGPNAPEPLPGLEELLYWTVDANSELSSESLGRAAAVSTAGSTFFYGNAINLAKYLSSAGLDGVGKASLSWPSFISRLVESFAAGAQPNTNARDVITLDGTKLHLLVPSHKGGPTVPPKPKVLPKIQAEAAERVKSMSPLAREPAAEFLVLLSQAVPVEDLNVTAIPETELKQLARRLSAIDVKTTADVIDAGAETLLAELKRPSRAPAGGGRARARPPGGERELEPEADLAKAVDAIVGTAEDLLQETAETLVEFAKKAPGPFMRTSLKDVALHETIVRNVHATELRKDLVARIAARVMAAR